MKLPKLLCYIFCLVTFFTFSECKKSTKTPMEQLPPETQTGANTFGCLVDGQVFIPKGDPFGGPIKKAQYQLVNGKYTFGISGQRNNNEVYELIGIIGDSVILATGTFELTTRSSGFFSAGYSRTTPLILVNDYLTNEVHKGQIVIKNVDSNNQIVSGTFWFDAKNSEGKIVKIREGRFDMQYVR